MTQSPAALAPAALTALHDRVQAEVDAGRVPAGQLAIGLGGEVVHARSFGDATDTTRFSVFSCTKAAIAGVVWQLIAEGSLRTDTRVAELVPSFAAADGITLEHLLTHTAGFPYAPLGPPTWDTREGRLAQFAKWRLQWEPGSRFEYHATSAHWVVAEMIEVVEGRDYRDVVRDRIIAPLGLSDFTLGAGADDGEAGEVAELRLVGELPTAAELEAAFGIPGIDLDDVLGEVTPDILLHFNDPQVRAVGVPGGGGISDASSLALCYQALLHNPDGLWNPAVLADGTGHIRCTLPDPVKQVPSNRTLGLIVAGDDGHSALRGMGHTVSPQAFGHNGAAGQIAWADPATGLSFAFCTSGVERDFIREARRTAAIASRAAVVLDG